MSKVKVGLNNKTILVTGSPGFIGANLVLRLLKEMKSGTVISLDNMNDYYDPALKEYRLGLIEEAAKASPVKHVFIKGSIADKCLIDQIFADYRFAVVVNLAAQAGVRYSIDHPDVYIESNLIGFYNILEACRHNPVEHLVYASSSSVYGGNKKVPFSTDDKVDNPVSLYAATKKSDELLAHAYSKLYNIPSTGLRFFTVYGPAGRPDMFYYSATNTLSKGGTIKIFNYAFHRFSILSCYLLQPLLSPGEVLSRECFVLFVFFARPIRHIKLRPLHGYRVVIPGNTTLRGWIVDISAFIDELRCVGENEETMGEAFWNVKHILLRC